MLMPTYGALLALWGSAVLCYLPLGTRLAVLLVVLGITCFLPMIVIAVLHNFKIVKDKRLNDRRERWMPYLFTIGCYIAAGFYLVHIHAPYWLPVFMWGGAAACVISFIVNFWWKISAHLAGIGGVLAFAFCMQADGLGAFNLFWLIIVLILLTGALASARLYMHRHTFWQAVAGFANGYICVYAFIRLFS
jgi:hypothetical protein